MNGKWKCLHYYNTPKFTVQKSISNKPRARWPEIESEIVSATAVCTICLRQENGISNKVHTFIYSLHPLQWNIFISPFSFSSFNHPSTVCSQKSMNFLILLLSKLSPECIIRSVWVFSLNSKICHKSYWFEEGASTEEKGTRQNQTVYWIWGYLNLLKWRIYIR